MNADATMLHEKWLGETEYTGERDRATLDVVLSGEAKEIRHQAVGKDLWDVLAGILEDEEEEWYDDEEDDIPSPEIGVTLSYTSPELFSIVKATIDRFWYPDEVSCDGYHDGKSVMTVSLISGIGLRGVVENEIVILLRSFWSGRSRNYHAGATS